MTWLWLCLWLGKEIHSTEAAPVQIANGMSYSISPDLTHFGMQEGRRVWQEIIDIPNAAFVKPHFKNFKLKKGDVLIVRSKNGVVEELRGFGPKGARTFWGLSAFGSKLTLELHFQSDYDELPFLVDEIMVGDPQMFAQVAGGPESVCAPPDFEDVICYDNEPAKWANVLASVGVMTVGSDPNNPSPNGLWCSGSNISAQNLVLTNEHCISNSGECANAEFVFRYYRTDCNNGSPPNNDWVSFRCDQTVASSPYNGFCDPNLSNLDYSLNSVIGDPASQFGFVEVDSTPLVDGEGIYIIQHPAGRPHEITHGSGSNVDVDGNTLRYYDTLDTEGGSSGSPIFREADHKLVGLHHCGGCSTAGTGNRGMLMSDIYPEISTFLCTQQVEVAAASTISLSEVIGDGDSFLEPGETWQFYPQLINRACGETAMNVQATFQLGSGSEPNINLLTTTAMFGDISPETTVQSLSPVQFEIGSSIDCLAPVVVDIASITSDSGGPFSGGEVLRETLGESSFTTYFEEDFGTFPGLWTIEDGGTGTGPAQTWTTADPGGRSLLNPPFCIADSDEHGSGNSMDEGLISPIIDLSSVADDTIWLRLNHYFRIYNQSQNEMADIEIRSSSTGGSWQIIHHMEQSDGDQTAPISIDISAYRDADVQIRFRYHNAVYEYWWAIDDLLIMGENFNCGTQCATTVDVNNAIGSWPDSDLLIILDLMSNLCPI